MHDLLKPFVANVRVEDIINILFHISCVGDIMRIGPRARLFYTPQCGIFIIHLRRFWAASWRARIDARLTYARARASPVFMANNHTRPYRAIYIAFIWL